MRKIIVTALLMFATVSSKPDCLNTLEPEKAVEVEKAAISVESEEQEIRERESETKKYVYYAVPQEYVMNGGEFPEELQEFTQDLCKERQLSYPLVLALIERETGYRNVGSNGHGSTGYMQIIPKWHKDRMEKFGAADMLEPKSNIAVGIDYLAELFGKYHEINLVLMAYNMGESGAKKLWEDGIYSSGYADYIMTREAEISLEIYGR